jgi:hypothetical protein
MPLRTFVTLLGTYLACLAVAGAAGALGSELYIYVGQHYFGVRPPDGPWTVPSLLVVCGILYFFSPRSALYLFTVLALGVWVGTLVGWGVFQWRPSPAQHLLGVAMTATAIYGWRIRDEYMDY